MHVLKSSGKDSYCIAVSDNTTVECWSKGRCCGCYCWCVPSQCKGICGGRRKLKDAVWDIGAKWNHSCLFFCEQHRQPMLLIVSQEITKKVVSPEQAICQSVTKFVYNLTVMLFQKTQNHLQVNYIHVDYIRRQMASQKGDKLVHEDRKDWDSHLETTLRAYCVSKQKSTPPLILHVSSPPSSSYWLGVATKLSCWWWRTWFWSFHG